MARAQPDPALASAIKQLREEHGLPQETLAHRAGLTKNSLQRIESAQSAPSWQTVRAIVRALGVSMAELDELVDAET